MQLERILRLIRTPLLNPRENEEINISDISSRLPEQLDLSDKVRFKVNLFAGKEVNVQATETSTSKLLDGYVVQKDSDQFMVIPSSYDSKYNLNIGRSDDTELNMIKLRTEAYRSLARALFDIVEPDVLITTTLSREVPCSFDSEDDFFKELADSGFSIVTGRLIPGTLDSQLKCNSYNYDRSPGRVEVSVTDHPFSGSTYASQDLNEKDFGYLFQTAISRYLKAR